MGISWQNTLGAKLTLTDLGFQPGCFSLLTMAEKREQAEIMMHMCLYLLHVLSSFKAL